MVRYDGNSSNCVVRVGGKGDSRQWVGLIGRICAGCWHGIDFLKESSLPETDN